MLMSHGKFHCIHVVCWINCVIVSQQNVDKLSSGAVSPSPSNEDLTDHDVTAPPTTTSPDQDSSHLPFEPPPPLLLSEPPYSDEDTLSQVPSTLRDSNEHFENLRMMI